MSNFLRKCYQFVQLMRRKRISKLFVLAVVILPYVVTLHDVYVTVVVNLITG